MRQALTVLLVWAAIPAVVSADDVVLVNGRTFEGVIVSAHDERQIRLRLPFGELALPASLVARVVESESALATFIERRGALAARDAAPEEWLELARWAELNGLEYGYREVIEIVAKQAPRLAGLAPHMRSLGYVLDDDGSAWTRAARAPRAEVAPVEREGAPSVGARPQEPPERSNSEHLSRAVELLAAAQLARENRAAREAGPRVERLAVQPVLVSPYILWTGWTFPPLHSSEAPPPADPNPGFPVVRRPADPTARALLRRQPGSLIPLGSLVR